MSGLRERRHVETKQLLVVTAFDLFIEHGFTNVSMEQVARSAGVSRSTLYRRFPTKEDLVLEVPTRWVTVFDDAVDALAPAASMADAIRRPLLAVAAHIDQNAESVRTAYQIFEQSPVLQQSGLATTTWLRRIDAILGRFSTADGETSLVLAGAYTGAIDAMMLHWARSGGTASVTEKIFRLLEHLGPILPPDQAG